jgi:NodT family efflux transporter outer membrane factor (OMF) lipoprotein
VRAQIATAEAVLERDRENLKLVHVAFDAGSVSRLDIVSADSQLASDATLIPPLRQELATARHALAVVVGDPAGAAPMAEPELAALTLPARLPISVPSELAARRPDILAAEAQLHAATAAVGVATANLYPHIELTASFGQQATEIGHLFDRSSGVFGLAGSLIAPLVDGGTRRAEKRAAEEAMHASAARYEQTVLVAFGQVADTLDAIGHGHEQWQAQGRARDAALDNVDLTQKSYHEGNVGVLQVLDAERLYQQARLGYVRADAQRYLDAAQLMLALGGAGPEELVAR